MVSVGHRVVIPCRLAAARQEFNKVLALSRWPNDAQIDRGHSQATRISPASQFVSCEWRVGGGGFVVGFGPKCLINYANLAN